MAINTMLWTLSYPEIRSRYPKAEVDRHLETALEAIYLASVKWPGVESALELYISLVEACRKAYDGDAEASYGVPSSESRAKSVSPESQGTISAFSTPSTVSIPLATNSNSLSQTPSSNDTQAGPDFNEAVPSFETAGGAEFSQTSASTPNVQHTIFQMPANTMGNGTNLFDPNGFDNPLPALLNYGAGCSPAEGWIGRDPFPAALDEPYVRLLSADYVPFGPMSGLDLTGQSELMNTLESGGFRHAIGEASPVSRSNRFSYSG